MRWFKIISEFLESNCSEGGFLKLIESKFKVNKVKTERTQLYYSVVDCANDYIDTYIFIFINKVYKENVSNFKLEHAIEL